MEEKEISSTNSPTLEIKKISKEKSFWHELIDIVFIVVVILLPIRYFVAQPFIVVGSSMYPTYENGDYLIVDEIREFVKDKKSQVIITTHSPYLFFHRPHFPLYKHGVINVMSATVFWITHHGST